MCYLKNRKHQININLKIKIYSMKTNHLIISAIAFSIMTVSCSEKTNSKPETKSHQNKEAEAQRKKDENFKKEAQADIDKLEAYTNNDGFYDKFEFLEDELTGGGWYLYSEGCNKNETHIEVPFAKNGFFYLKAHFTGKDWLFYKSITVSIDGKTNNSSILSVGSDFKVEKIGGKGIYETAHFTKPSLDMEIVRLIAENIDKKIIVRFNGDEINYDLTLSNSDKQRIKDCYMLARYLTYNENEKLNYFGDGNKVEHKLLLTDYGAPDGDIKALNYTK
jgi:hypothetical protein